MATTTKTATTKEVAKYSKQQILSSKRYSDKRDVLNVVLDDYMRYTIDEIEKLIANFLKGKVR